MLRGRAVGGWKFRRQQRVGRFTADFACQAARLVIEVDGDTHAHRVEKDRMRTQFLESEGYCVIRFTNLDVLQNSDGVWLMIEQALAAAPSPSHPAAPDGPLPLPRGERGR